jgi:hypothetical protein
MLAYIMKRTTVKVPDVLDARMRHEAARRGTTISEITRLALEAFLGDGDAWGHSGGDRAEPHVKRRLGAAGAGRSGRSDVSERIEEILATEVGIATEVRP